MIGVRHALLGDGLSCTTVVPVQLQDGVLAVRVQEVDETDDRLLVAGGRLAVGEAVDAQPTVLVERYTDGVRVPGCDACDRRIVDWAIESIAARAGAHVLRAGTIHAEQPDRLAAAVDEVIALNSDRECGSRGAQRAGDGGQSRSSDEGAHGAEGHSPPQDPISRCGDEERLERTRNPAESQLP